jgi:hypothetical protein
VLERLIVSAIADFEIIDPVCMYVFNTSACVLCVQFFRVRVRAEGVRKKWKRTSSTGAEIKRSKYARFLSNNIVLQVGKKKRSREFKFLQPKERILFTKERVISFRLFYWTAVLVFDVPSPLR